MVLREHVICGGYFWEKGGYTLDDIMKRENHKKILERVTMILYSTVIFGTCQIILNISFPVFRIRHSIFPDTLNKGVYGISFILTQEVYLYTPVFLYALYISIFVLIPTAYKRFYFPYLATFYAVLLNKLSSVTHRNLYLLCMNQEVKNTFTPGPVVSYKVLGG